MATPKPMGLLGPALMHAGPVRILGTVQNGGPEVPPSCPKCTARPPMWIIGPVSRCVACGTRWYRTTHTYQPPEKKKVHPYPVWMWGEPKEATA